MTARVLLIDDDQRLTRMLVEYLQGRGFEAHARHDATTGLRALRDGEWDALILDLMLPDTDGLELCRRIRRDSALPILMLTARGDDEDRIVGLELGADDYLPKPFNPRELVARLQAILRRSGRGDPAATVLRFGELEIDREAQQVRLRGQPCALTSHQVQLLLALAESAGRVLSREALMDRVKGQDLDAFDRSIDVHISRIRAVIEDDPRKPRRILTRRGLGYVLVRGEGG